MTAWVRRNDRRGRFVLVPYQQAPSPPMTPELYEDCARAMNVIRADGRRLRAGRAALYVLARLGYGPLVWIGWLPPFSWLVEIAYRFVADHRTALGRFLGR